MSTREKETRTVATQGSNELFQSTVKDSDDQATTGKTMIVVRHICSYGTMMVKFYFVVYNQGRNCTTI